MTFLQPWIWRMAWRETRKTRRRLLFFSTSIVFGIAALVGIGSLGSSLERAVDEQARTMVGADLVLSSRRPLTPGVETIAAQIKGDQAREVAFSSMLFIPRSDQARLVQVRGIEGPFPFYGELETEPRGAARAYYEGKGALLEETLVNQFNVQVGDEIKLGELRLPVLGILRRVPGENMLFGALAPRVYLSMEQVRKTGLLRDESLARHRIYFKLPETNPAETVVNQFTNAIESERLNVETVAKRKQELGKSMDNLQNFLSLTGFVALLLGGVGVASAIHVLVQEKRSHVAIFRCLGARVIDVFTIYVLQGAGLGIVGAVLGCGLGVAFQLILPWILADLLPVKVPFVFSWVSLFKGAGFGFSFCFLFTLYSLLPLRSISPLATLRAQSEPSPSRDWLRFGTILMIALMGFGFALDNTTKWRDGIGFAAGVTGVFALFWSVGKILMALLKRFKTPFFGYELRQGLANLHRPANRTILLIMSLGLASFLVLTLFLVQRSLVGEFISTEGTQGNTVLFDIQNDQLQGVEKILKERGASVLEQAPVVTMRIGSVKGITVDELLKKRRPDDAVPGWVLRREYRSTYRNDMRDAESLVSGTWPPAQITNGNKIAISLEEGIARDLKVGLGDDLVFDVQGVPLDTKIVALRKVDWRRVQPNFFVVFPEGVLDEAPRFHILLTRLASAGQSSELQTTMVKAFPNISMIDLRLILSTLETIVGKISFVIQSMALFVVFTGVLVITGAILSGRFQRVEEAVLLRTLGASKSQVLKIFLWEYFFLGAAGAATGILLASIAHWVLLKFLFKMDYHFQGTPMLIALLMASALTMIIGRLGSKGVISTPLVGERV